jgi:chromate reductase
MAKILAFAGSLREHSLNKRILKIAVEGARTAGGDVTVIDLRDYPMPIYNEDDHKAKGLHVNAQRFQDLLGEHNGFLIASPEYNGSIPGGLKNAIDWASRKSEKYELNQVFKNKWGAMITASPGSFGGLRCIAHLRAVLSIMGVIVLPMEIAVPFASQKFDGDGEEMADEKTRRTLETIGASLVEVIRMTRTADKRSAESS